MHLLNFIFEFGKAAWAYMQALYYLFKYRPYKYILVLLLLTSLFLLPIGFLDLSYNFLLDYWHNVPGHHYFWLMINWLASLSGFILLIILSPVFSWMSEEVGQKLAGKKNGFECFKWLKDIWRGIRMSLRNLAWQTLGFLILSGISIFLPDKMFLKYLLNLLFWLLNAYFYGLTILDYALENERLSYKQSIHFSLQHTGLVLGLGAVYEIMLNLNKFSFFHFNSAQLNTFWPVFSEALVAFLGVLASSIIIFKNYHETLINKKAR